MDAYILASLNNATHMAQNCLLAEMFSASFMFTKYGETARTFFMYQNYSMRYQIEFQIQNILY